MRTLAVVSVVAAPLALAEGLGDDRRAASGPSRLIISEVVDGTLAGGNPKFVEITNTGDRPFTFRGGGVIIQANRSTDLDIDVDLSGVRIGAGESFVIQSAKNDGQLHYEQTYDDPADMYADAFFGNGNDRYLLTDADDASSVLDIFGENGVDGEGSSWEYTDSHAHRVERVAEGSGATFEPGEWEVAEPGSLAGVNDAAERELIRAATTPGRHTFR